VSDLNKTDEIMSILSKNLTKKDFKKVMDFIYGASMGMDFNYSNALYQKLLNQYYETTDQKENVVKLNLVKGGKND
tara:strand:- start:6976 stop:7203 length:228 start_codon:yes stop_codon:yes gene_type:complete